MMLMLLPYIYFVVLLIHQSCCQHLQIGHDNLAEEDMSSHPFLHSLPGYRQTEIGVNITRILNAFFDSGYDKRVRPNYGGPPVDVGVTMYIISISSVSEVQMDFTSDFYFRQTWKDPRLSFEARPGIQELFVGAEVADRIWVPDTFFANEKSAYFHEATTPNTFLRIGHTGEVFRSVRLTVTASCPMDLQYFPLDRQLCTIEVESYGYSMTDIRYRWAKGGESVGIQEKLELPQFRLLGHRQKMKHVSLSTGNYSRLICEIQFARSMGYYLIQIYIPASLIVIISWVSFWLHRNATPARVALGVTTVLTMTTLMSSTNAALPKISYIKSIDVYLGTCFVMVFASLLEYATVGYLGKRIAMRRSRSQQLSRLAELHRQKCTAAAAAATVDPTLEEGGRVSIFQPVNLPPASSPTGQTIVSSPSYINPSSDPLLQRQFLAQQQQGNPYPVNVMLQQQMTSTTSADPSHINNELGINNLSNETNAATSVSGIICNNVNNNLLLSSSTCASSFPGINNLSTTVSAATTTLSSVSHGPLVSSSVNINDLLSCHPKNHSHQHHTRRSILSGHKLVSICLFILSLYLESIDVWEASYD